jgi:hypothetical protein
MLTYSDDFTLSMVLPGLHTEVSCSPVDAPHTPRSLSPNVTQAKIIPEAFPPASHPQQLCRPSTAQHHHERRPARRARSREANCVTMGLLLLPARPATARRLCKLRSYHLELRHSPDTTAETTASAATKRGRGGAVHGSD